jgi:hypothetical protein
VENQKSLTGLFESSCPVLGIYRLNGEGVAALGRELLNNTFPTELKQPQLNDNNKFQADNGMPPKF